MYFFLFVSFLHNFVARSHYCQLSLSSFDCCFVFLMDFCFCCCKHKRLLTQFQHYLFCTAKRTTAEEKKEREKERERGKEKSCSHCSRKRRHFQWGTINFNPRQCCQLPPRAAQVASQRAKLTSVGPTHAI